MPAPCHCPKPPFRGLDRAALRSVRSERLVVLAPLFFNSCLPVLSMENAKRLTVPDGLGGLTGSFWRLLMPELIKV